MAFNRKIGLFLAGFLVLSLLFSGLVSAYFEDYDNYNWNRRGTDTFKETTEFKKTTSTSTGDYWGSEKRTTTVSEKTVVERKDHRPYYGYDYYPSRYSNPRSYGYYDYGNDCYSSSCFRYKEPYRYSNYGSDRYGYDSYYAPRYDWNTGSYNWRY